MALVFRNVKFMVVEDNLPIREIISAVLESLEAGDIITASNGKEGFDKVKRYNPDIIIIDWEMEPINGIELAKMIRTDPMSPNKFVPIIMLTGYASPQRIAAARDIGITEYLLKPFTAASLISRISYVINKPRDFVETGAFFGPDRRRRDSTNYEGPRRRDSDRGKGQA